MKIMSHNVRVWTRDRDPKDEWYWRKRMNELFGIIIGRRPQILCLQELSYPATKYIPEYYYRRVCPSISHPIYVEKDLQTRNHQFHFRWDSCEVKIGGEWVIVVNVHLHWNDAIFQRCIEKINNVLLPGMYGQPVIACGDWNVSAQKVSSEILNPQWLISNKSYTFKNKTTGKTATIDHFVTNYAESAELTVLKPSYVVSDHRPLILSV